MSQLPKRRMGAGVYVKQPAYLLVMLRELSAFFIAPYLIFTIVLLFKLVEGPAEYDAFISCLASPVLIPLHVIAVAFALLHTITWFSLLPKVLVVWKPGSDEKLPGWILVAGHYLGWIAISIILLVLVLKVST